MLDFFLGKAISFILGDILGPGIVIFLLLAVAVIALLRGYKMICYAAVVVAILLGAFLAGAQTEKKFCDIRMERAAAKLQAMEDSEVERQKKAREEVDKLQRENEVLTRQFEEARRKDVAPIIKEIEKLKVVEVNKGCTSASWNKRERDGLRNVLQGRRDRSGDQN